MAEFDQHARSYRDLHVENLALTGEEPEYFARQKIAIAREHWSALSPREPACILDFGAGIGNSWPFLKDHFPASHVIGADVSASSLEVAAERFPGMAEGMAYERLPLPIADGSVDLVFSACVFHHIPVEERAGVIAEMKRVLAPGGMIMIFEHNPANPVTRHIVATCPFDENAILLWPSELVGLQRAAGLGGVRTIFTGFFPSALAKLRPLERYLGALPVGAQYYTVARA